MANKIKSIKPKTSDMVEESIFKIGQLMHKKFTSSQLMRIRDMVISNCHGSWNRKSFLGQAYMFHWYQAGLKSDKVKYHDLLLAELIRTFGIATKKEYLEKCKEFRIIPFIDKVKEQSEKEKKLHQKKIKEFLTDAFQKVSDDALKKKKDEVENSLKQPYPICSLDEFSNKNRNN